MWNIYVYSEGEPNYGAEIEGIKLNTFEDFQKLHELYNKLLDEFFELSDSLFKKPHVKTFAAAVGNNNIDLYNINDSCFSEAITYSEIKEHLDEDSMWLEQLVNSKPCLFFNKSGELAFIFYQSLKLLNVNLPYNRNIDNNYMYKYFIGGIQEGTKMNVKEFADKYVLSHYSRNFRVIFGYRKEIVFKNIFMAYKNSSYTHIYLEHAKMEDQFISSNTYYTKAFCPNGELNTKLLKWGLSNNDYMITFNVTPYYNENPSTPDTAIFPLDKKFPGQYKYDQSSIVGFNEIKRGKNYDSYYNKRKEQKHNDFLTSSIYMNSQDLRNLADYFKKHSDVALQCMEYGYKVVEQDFNKLHVFNKVYADIAKTNYIQYKGIHEAEKLDRSLSYLKTCLEEHVYNQKELTKKMSDMTDVDTLKAYKIMLMNYVTLVGKALNKFYELMEKDKELKSLRAQFKKNDFQIGTKISEVRLELKDMMKEINTMYLQSLNELFKTLSEY